MFRHTLACVTLLVLLSSPGWPVSLHAEKPHPGRPVGKHLSIPATVFQQGTTVRVSWFDTPGNPQDWVTVVPVRARDNQWGKWTFTEGKLEGTFEVTGLEPDDYEARLYLNWPEGGFKVVERLKFTVVPYSPVLTDIAQSTGQLSTSEKVFSLGKPVLVGWHDTPGNQQDWLTVVLVGTSDNEWGPWIFTRGRKSGSFKVDGLAAGEYEARLYLDWPQGKFRVVDRIRFQVR
jgi:hypothetical protein